jgi:hypothetical protein
MFERYLPEKAFAFCNKKLLQQIGRLQVYTIRFRAMKIVGDRLRQVLARIKHLLGMERRLTVQEVYKLLQLSEMMIDHGRMLQSYFGSPMRYVWSRFQNWHFAYARNRKRSKTHSCSYRKLVALNPMIVDAGDCPRLARTAIPKTARFRLDAQEGRETLGRSDRILLPRSVFVLCVNEPQII